MDSILVTIEDVDLTKDRCFLIEGEGVTPLGDEKGESSDGTPD